MRLHATKAYGVPATSLYRRSRRERQNPSETNDGSRGGNIVTVGDTDGKPKLRVGTKISNPYVYH